MILNTPPQAQVGSVSDSIRSPVQLVSIHIDIVESVFQLALCVVRSCEVCASAYVVARLFAALLCGSSRLLRVIA